MINFMDLSKDDKKYILNTFKKNLDSSHSFSRLENFNKEKVTIKNFFFLVYNTKTSLSIEYFLNKIKMFNDEIKNLKEFDFKIILFNLNNKKEYYINKNILFIESNPTIFLFVNSKIMDYLPCIIPLDLFLLLIYLNSISQSLYHQFRRSKDDMLYLTNFIQTYFFRIKNIPLSSTSNINQPDIKNYLDNIKKEYLNIK